jgi:hypothetical protein
MSAQTNRIFCNNCVCYVCQKSPAQCRDWFVFGRQGLRNNHCNATVNSGAGDSKRFWMSLRYNAGELEKKSSELAETQHAEALELANRPKTVGPGPFEPSNQAAGKDQNLTQCRKCQWYNRFPKITAETIEDLRRPTVFVNHWCHACGRVASALHFGKEQSREYLNQGDISLGTQTISFSLHTHDPRVMDKFRKRWADNQGKPAWTLDETEMEEELFHHRFGKRPTLANILASIPVLPRDLIPVNGCLNRGAGHKVASASETQALILDDPSDIVVLQEIQRNSVMFGDGRRPHYDALGGDIQAHWDNEQRKGVSLLYCIVLSMLLLVWLLLMLPLPVPSILLVAVFDTSFTTTYISHHSLVSFPITLVLILSSGLYHPSVRGVRYFCLFFEHDALLGRLVWSIPFCVVRRQRETPSERYATAQSYKSQDDRDDPNPPI